LVVWHYLNIKIMNKKQLDFYFHSPCDKNGYCKCKKLPNRIRYNIKSGLIESKSLSGWSVLSEVSFFSFIDLDMWE
jgi:hypothetical protein